MGLRRWWTARLRAVEHGGTYVRLYPNPGFRLALGRRRALHWSVFRGWKWER